MYALVTDWQTRLHQYLSNTQQLHGSLEKVSWLNTSIGRETWLLNTKLNRKPHHYILRRELASPISPLLDCESEGLLLLAATETGIQTKPFVLVCSDNQVIGAPFLLTEADAKAKTSPKLPLNEQTSAQLALIHKLSPIQHRLGFLPVPRAGHSPAQERIAQCRDLMESLSIQHPLFEFVLRWAEQYAPKTSRLVVVHGSFIPENLIKNQNELQSIGGWENDHMGDALEDIAGYLMRAWRSKSSDWTGERTTFIDTYEQYSGSTIDKQLLRYWEILLTLQWAIWWTAQAKSQLLSRSLSIHAAYQARRSTELQFDVIELIEAAGL